MMIVGALTVGGDSPIPNHDESPIALPLASTTTVTTPNVPLRVRRNAHIETKMTEYIAGTSVVISVMLASRNALLSAAIPVTTGADIGDWTAVTSGNVKPGMEVVIRGTERLFPFPSPVRIVDEHGTAVESRTANSK